MAALEALAAGRAGAAMITRADYEREVDAIIVLMQQQGVPDDIIDKVVTVLNTLHARLWPEGAR